MRNYFDIPVHVSLVDSLVLDICLVPSPLHYQFLAVWPTFFTEEIKFLGEQLLQINYFDSTYVMYLYVDKENDALKISVPFVDPEWDDPEAIKYFENIHTQLKTAYLRKNFIEVLMCDTVLNVHRRLK